MCASASVCLLFCTTETVRAGETETDLVAVDAKCRRVRAPLRINGLHAGSWLLQQAAERAVKSFHHSQLVLHGLFLRRCPPAPGSERACATFSHSKQRYQDILNRRLKRRNQVRLALKPVALGCRSFTSRSMLRCRNFPDTLRSHGSTPHAYT